MDGRGTRPRRLLKKFDVGRPWTFGRLFDHEFDALTFAKQLEHRLTNGRTMEEMLYAAFVADEAKTLIDQQTCNRAVGHDSPFPMATPPMDAAGDSFASLCRPQLSSQHSNVEGPANFSACCAARWP